MKTFFDYVKGIIFQDEVTIETLILGTVTGVPVGLVIYLLFF